MGKESDALMRARNRASNSLTELARAEAREHAREGARDTKRKILLGAAAEVMMRTDETLRARFASFMPSFLKRRQDLEAFDLVGSDRSYFDRLAPSADSEIDDAVNLLTDSANGLHLGATKVHRAPPPRGSPSGAPTSGSDGNGIGGSNGIGPRPPPLPPPSSSSQS